MDYDANGKQITRILIVDDVEANRYILRNIISDMGYQPILAENGVQALKIMEKCIPNLILLDISMPEMDGYELCGIIKQNPDMKDIPVIFISAYDEPSDIVKGFSLGGEDYITKPFISEVVKARVDLHLKLNETSKNLMEINRRLQASVNEQIKQIEQEKKKVLYALANVARENSFYEDEHMKRLQYNCRILTQAMQLSPLYEHLISDSYVEAIELSAPLCDVGNLAVPIEILQKKSSLTYEEYENMKKHTTIGAKLLKDISMTGDYNDFLQMSEDIAHYHHENWDGTGYPKGLKGDEIPLSAQIVAIISNYCALTEIRKYRESYTREQALEIMSQDVGKKFNADIYNICKKIARQLR